MGTESQKVKRFRHPRQRCNCPAFCVPEEENIRIVQLCQWTFTQEDGPPWISKRESGGIVRIQFVEAKSSWLLQAARKEAPTHDVRVARSWRNPIPSRDYVPLSLKWRRASSSRRRET